MSPANQEIVVKQKLIKLADVVILTSLSRSSIYSYMALGAFPKPIRIGRRAVAWREREVLDWLASRIRT